MFATTPAARIARLVLLLFACAPIGCSRQETTDQELTASGGTKMAIIITSSAFKNNQPIPRKYTGEAEDVSPPLSWSNVPAQTKELALICDDPDAPTPEPWVHWLIYKLPPGTAELPEAVPPERTLKTPAGAMQGTNSFNKIGYGGPLPPKGHGVHHYHFKLYALSKPLPLQPGIEKKALVAAMKGAVIAEGELVGTYERK